MVIRSCRDLKVHQLAFRLAKEVFEITKKFPKEELYCLVNQIRRSSRSVSANIREGYAKRRYGSVFVRHLNDSIGSCEETREWLDFSLECGYITETKHKYLNKSYDEVTAMLYSLMNSWQTFTSRGQKQEVGNRK